MDDEWTSLRRQLGAELEAVQDHETLAEELRPCWIFVSNVRDAKSEGRRFDEPATGVAKLGGLPDLPVSEPWPLTSAGESMDFLAQIRLSDGPQLPHLPDSGLLLFFSGSDDTPSCIEHKVVFAPEGRALERRQRPDVERIYHSQDYLPYVLSWVPSMALRRRWRYFMSDDGEEFGDDELQQRVDGAALRIAGFDPSRFAARGGCMTRFGGWPLEQDGDAPALSAYIDDAGFGIHEVLKRDGARVIAFKELQKPRSDLMAIAENIGSPAERVAALLRLADTGDEFCAWASDPQANHAVQIDAWKQLLSLDSHMEIGMCFWDAGRYEFVTHERELATMTFKGRMDLYGFG